MTETRSESLSFAAFVLSLATTAAVHFGDLADPNSGDKHEPDLQAASHLIEILGLLVEKTRGNLTTDEQRLLGQILYELRMRYVAATEPQKRIIVP
jgi:hypothetical protein